MEQEIMNLIIAIAPALTAIVGVIGSVVIMIKKVKNIDAKHSKEVKTTNEQHSKSMNDLHTKMDIVLAENAELKRQLTKTLKIINHVKDDE